LGAKHRPDSPEQGRLASAIFTNQKIKAWIERNRLAFKLADLSQMKLV
jgi:hypothetical protein